MAILAKPLSTPKTILLVAAAIALAAVAAVEVNTNTYLRMMGGLLFLIVGVMAALTQMSRPLLGIGLLVATGVAFPVEFRGPAGVMMGSSLPLSGVLCALWLFHVVLTRSPIDRSRVVYSSMGFAGTALVSFAAGQFPYFPNGAPLPAQIVQLGLILLSVLLFLSVGHQFKTLRDLKYLTTVMIAAGLVAAVVISVPYLATKIGDSTTHTNSIGSLFWTWLLAMSLSQALLNRDLSATTRTILLGIAGLVLFHGLVQVRSWASGWLPPLMALGVIALVRFPRTAVAGGLVGVPVLIIGFQYLSAGVMGDESYSLLSREQAWVTLWRLVERSPIVGTGLANYYYYTENFPLLGWYVRFIAHNNYQDMLVQTGFVGVLAFAWFSFELIAMLLSLIPRVPAGFAYAYVVGALGATVGSLGAGMLGDWIIPFYYNAGILGFRSSMLMWVFLGGALALKRMTRSVAEAEMPARDPAAVPRRRHFRRVPQPDWV